MSSDEPIGADPSIVNVVAIVSAYVSHNSLRPSDLPDLIGTVHAALRDLKQGEAPRVAPTVEPAVPIKKSLHRDYVICLEDGKKFKSLRRHLNSFHNLSPEEYRAKWGLPNDYPMVAPAYSATRSRLAKHAGLGHLARASATDPGGAPDGVEATGSQSPARAGNGAEAVKAKRGRPRKQPT